MELKLSAKTIQLRSRARLPQYNTHKIVNVYSNEHGVQRDSRCCRIVDGAGRDVHWPPVLALRAPPLFRFVFPPLVTLNPTSLLRATNNAVRGRGLGDADEVTRYRSLDRQEVAPRRHADGSRCCQACAALGPHAF